MVTCSTEGANSYFNSAQEYIHSHTTHFEEVITQKGHLSVKRVSLLNTCLPQAFLYTNKLLLENKGLKLRQIFIGHTPT